MTKSTDILLARMRAQSLLNHEKKSPTGIVKSLGGIQGQDYAGGEWSIGLRLPGSTLADIERAISRREIVRTWAMRGTLHFLAAADICWMLDLLAPKIIGALSRYYKNVGLNDKTFRKAEAILADSLEGGKQLTRKELVTILEKAGISCEGLRATFMLHRASLDRVICFGVTREKKETHALFEEWVLPAKPMKRSDPLAELARRYFTGYGPATIQDYMWWSGLRAPDARAGLESIQSELDRVSVGKKDYWMPRREPPAKSKTPIIHLLPPFDSFLLGYKDRDASIEPVAAKQLRTEGIPDATIVVDGKVVGKWSRKSFKDRITITTEYFRTLSVQEARALRQSVDRYAGFLQKNPEWTG